MSWLSRLGNAFRRDRLDREIEEELSSHLEEALEQGRSAGDARRAFGGSLQMRERSRDIRVLPWLDAVLSDIVFGWRQLHKRRAASAAAILSLGLAIGATTAVYRLVDALLLRPLAVAEPERLFYVATSYIDREGRPDYREDFDYPTFRKYRDAASSLADLMVVGMNALPANIQIGEEPERARRQFVSGNVFPVFGLRPALGRLFTPDDDRTPGAHPVVVLGHDYWTRRFAADPNAVGRTFRLGGDIYQIVGIAPKSYAGSEPGVVTDIFLPAMMNAQAINSPGWSWFQIWARPKLGVSEEQVRQVLQAVFDNARLQTLKNFHSDTPKQVIDNAMAERVMLLPAGHGASPLQKEYRRPLLILGLLVALVLLVACANVGNLLMAQASARVREMALRVSIGAGRMRLVQLVLVESAMVAALGSGLGMLFAWWSAPWIVSMLRGPHDPVRLIFDFGWRAWAFSALLALLVTVLFGLAPALRASAVQPMSALKGGEDPHARRRMMNTLLAAQMAFCVLVLFIAGLFVATFERLSNRPLGFSHERILLVGTSSSGEQPADVWLQVAQQLRGMPGVESASFAAWPLLSGNRWTASVRLAGRAAEARSPYFLDVGSGFFETLKMSMVDGRDLRLGDRAPGLIGKNEPFAGVGVVNEAFARTYFDGRNPVGRWVDVLVAKDVAAPMEIVGLVRDAAYGNLREAIRPTVYVPQKARSGNTLIVRAAVPPRTIAAELRRRITAARADFRVRNVETQTEFVNFHLLRERLLAALSLFFAVVALALAAIGLYGVLNYSVTRERREIGIRMALGARAGHVVRKILAHSAVVVCFGLAIGLAGGLAAARLVQSLLYDVRPGDWDAVAAPALALLVAAGLAAAPPAIRATRIDPAKTLRSE
jgi:predicted permease